MTEDADPAALPRGRRVPERHRRAGDPRGAPGLPAAHLRRVRSVRLAGEGGQRRRRRRSPRSTRTTRTSRFGENLGAPDCDVPVERFRWLPTRQPVALDLWRQRARAAGAPYTTITTWHNKGKNVDYRGETLLLDEGPRVREVPRPAAAPAGAVRAGRRRRRRRRGSCCTSTAGGSATRSTSRRRRPLPRLHPAVARRVHRGARPVRAAATPAGSATAAPATWPPAGR